MLPNRIYSDCPLVQFSEGGLTQFMKRTALIKAGNRLLLHYIKKHTS